MDNGTAMNKNGHGNSDGQDYVQEQTTIVGFENTSQPDIVNWNNALNTTTRHPFLPTDIDNFFKRPMEVARFNWTVGDAEGTELIGLEFPGVYFDTFPGLVGKLRNFAYWALS